MKLSINNGHSAVWTGHGHVTLKLLSNLAKTHHSIVSNRPCDFELTFAHPVYYKFYGEDSFKIGYTAWESTEIPEDWHEGLSQIDELWVPNNFCKDVMSKYFNKEIYVFPHGIDETFEAKQRVVGDTINFLHIGHPAYRKGLDLVLDAWEEMFADNPRYHLTIKGFNNHALPEVKANNITFIKETVTASEMVNLLHRNHVLLYPSWGEGFGLIPLQALATGMPVIMTQGWSDYDHYIGDLLIKSKLSYSPWQVVHPGKMFKPDYEHFKRLMRHAELNIESLLEKHYNLSSRVHEDYNWEKIVVNHFNNFEARLVV